MTGWPGGNLLALANKVIAPQQLLYRPFLGRVLNIAGVYETRRASPVSLLGNIQPVPRSRYEIMGLDFQKNYAMIYVQKNAIDIERDVTGDQFWYSGRLYQAESRTSWFAQDGWESVLCIEEPGYTPPFPSEGNCDAITYVLNGTDEVLHDLDLVISG